MMNSIGLTVLQWNCRGLYKKLPEFKNFLYSLKTYPDLIFLQETHLIEKYSPRLPGYSLFRRDRSLSRGGLATFIKDNLRATMIRVPTTREFELQCIQIENIRIYHFYIPPNYQIRDDDFDFIQNPQSRVILLGDFNAHHYSWSVSDTTTSNQRGRKLFEFFEYNGLVLLNYSNPTRINVAVNAVNRRSLLELTVASHDISSKCRTLVTD